MYLHKILLLRIIPAIGRCLPALVAACLYLTASAQPGTDVDLNKPDKYESRKLKSERTGEKKFTLPRRFMNNLTTHYNYYFNANNRLNEVINRAKQSFKDDYTQLLPFYNYTLETTAQDKGELDSVLYKATAGILLHDLRSDWVDNMYLLMAKAYLYRNDLDSATMTLQYLNYAFAPKEDGYDIPIGSNVSNQAGEFSIATKEGGNVFKKVFGRPPSRNTSFIWQIRTFIEKDEMPEAAGLIEILRNDPYFPERLEPELNEVTAYWFYKQKVYDSAASYLGQALDQASNTAEQARWEYLIGQMYSRSGNAGLAAEYFEKSIQHTIDPVMDVYARLNLLKLDRGDGRDYASENIEALLKMARRDKYLNYRDIIYYAAATIEHDRNNYAAAEELLLKSVAAATSNPAQRNQSFLLLADMNFGQKKYSRSYNYYDSVDVNALKLQEDRDRLTGRKPPLKIIAENETIVFTQDSLQALAAMPEAKRDAVIKARLKEIRKAQGLKEDDMVAGSVNPAIPQQANASLFDNNSKGTFYFYDAAQKARGYSAFVAKWGKRPNVDNWRRLQAINQQFAAPQSPDITDVPSPDKGATETGARTAETMLNELPLTEELLTASNDKIETALNTLGETFLSGLEDYPSAIHAYEELLRRFPNSQYRNKALFNLVYAWLKAGDPDKSRAYKQQLLNTADTSNYAQRLARGNAATTHDNEKAAITRRYEQIYDQFIEGDFANAIHQKRMADSLYGNTYWTPQLLYIESIYYVSRRDDSVAIGVLNNLATQFADNPMAEKAKTMIDVLKRRTEIEDYLSKLEINRRQDAPPPVYKPVPVPADTSAPVAPPAADTLQQLVLNPKQVDAGVINTSPKNTIAPANAPVVNASRENALSVSRPKTNMADSATVVADGKKNPGITAPSKTATLPTPGSATNQVAVGTNRPTVPAPTSPPPITPTTGTQLKDTLPAIHPPVTSPVPSIVYKNFEFKPADAHYVMVVLDKVDPVYASEAKNAFSRFNRDRYYNAPIQIEALKLDDRYNLLLQGPFGDANAAVTYIDNVRPITASRILPWLKADKYSYLVISQQNLDALKTNTDMDAYRQLLQQAFPGKF